MAMPYLWYIPVRITAAPDLEHDKTDLLYWAYEFELGRFEKFEKIGEEFVHKADSDKVIRPDGPHDLFLEKYPTVCGKHRPDETLWRYCQYGSPLPIWPENMLGLFLLTLPGIAKRENIPSPYRMVFHPSWTPILDPQWDDLRSWGILRAEPFGPSPVYGGA